jgi:hypothetical protein
MSKFIGRLVDLGIGVEATRGVGVAPTFWLPKTSFGIRDEAPKARSEAGFGTIAGMGAQSLVSMKHASGDVEFDLYDRSFGAILYALFGTVSTAAQGDSTYKHSFSVTDDVQNKSLSLVQIRHDLTQLLYELSMVNSVSLEILPDDVVKATVNFMSKASAGTSGHTASYSTVEYKFLGRHASLKLATDTSGLAAASKINAKRVVINFQKNVSFDHTLGTIQPQDIVNQHFTINGEIELNVEDDTYRDLMADGSYRALRLRLTNTDETIGNATQNPEFSIDLSRVDFEAWEPSYPNDELATQALTFHALYDQTNENVVNDCYLINEQVSY